MSIGGEDRKWSISIRKRRSY